MNPGLQVLLLWICGMGPSGSQAEYTGVPHQVILIASNYQKMP
jgi:hypothetical protein